MAYEVTIGIPVYNVEQYIRQTMDSALAQTFPDIEFLVLDDCGTDSSMDIVREYQHTHPRGRNIRIVRQPKNLGIGQGRNRIIDEALGHYLFFLDADDLMVPDAISLLVDVARKYEVQFVAASYEKVETYHGHVKKIEYLLPSKVFRHEHELATFAFAQYGALQANVWNVLMDLQLLRQYSLRFIDTNYWEDMAFKYTMVTYITRAVLLPNVTYSYMCRENSLSNFQARQELPKSEVLRNVATINVLKQDYRRLLKKPYFAGWLEFVLKTDFFIILNVLKNRHLIHPSISNYELQHFLDTPLSVWQTLRYTNMRCFLFKLLSLLPTAISIRLIKLMQNTKAE